MASKVLGPNKHVPSVPWCELLLQNMNQLRQHGQLCDVVIVIVNIDGSCHHPISAHRNVLSSASGYFKAMFTSNLKETSCQEVRLFNLDAEAVEAWINFMYTSEIVLNENTVFGLLRTGDYLQMLMGLELCLDYLRKNLRSRNCVRIWALADTLECAREIRPLAEHYTQKHFDKACRDDQILELNVDQLLRLVADDLLTTDEECVFETVMRWAKHNRQLQLLPELLANVKVELLSDEYFAKHLLNDRTLAEHCPEVLQRRQPPTDAQTLPQPSSLSCRSGPPKSLIILGDQQELIAYDYSDNSWRPLTSIPTSRSGLVAMDDDDRLFLLGGRAELRTSTAVYVYHTELDDFTTEADMPTKRLSFEVAAMAGRLYALGGTSKQRLLDLVETYDTREGVWRRAAPLPAPLAAHAVASDDDRRLMVTGGVDADCRVQSAVHLYDPRNDAWLRLPDMRARRGGHGMAFVDGKFVVCGGNDGGAGAVKTAEMFELNAANWRPMADMHLGRWRTRLCAFDRSSLCCVGGVEEAASRSLEVMTEVTAGWTLVNHRYSFKNCYGMALASLPFRLCFE